MEERHAEARRMKATLEEEEEEERMARLRPRPGPPRLRGPAGRAIEHPGQALPARSEPRALQVLCQVVGVI